MTGFPQLYIVSDTDQTVVSLHEVDVVGRAQWREWAGIVEETAAPPIREGDPGWSRLPRVAPLVIVCALVLCAAGAAWWLVLAAAIPTGLIAGAARKRAAAAGAIVMPTNDPHIREHVVLTDGLDRRAFMDSVRTAERVSATWPALGQLIDRADVERMVAGALWQLAGVLDRRQQIRSVRSRLQGRDVQSVPADGAVGRKLKAQRAHLDAMLAQVNDDISRHARYLTAAENTAVAFIAEKKAERTAREAEEAVVLLEPTGLPEPAALGQDLADHTEAVLAAYRELAALYPGVQDQGW